MKCPRCRGSTKILRSPCEFTAAVHKQMNEVRRRHECQSCCHQFDTLELDAGEVSRLRTLAYHQTIANVAFKKGYSRWRG